VSKSVFAELAFWLLVAASFMLPVAIYVVLLAKRVVSRVTILIVGLMLVALSGVDLYLLQVLSAMAKLTESLLDDAIFNSEVTLALYLLPAVFGGVGVNLLSHVLVRHVAEAEAQFEKQNPE
jgi:hypothetical protein